MESNENMDSYLEKVSKSSDKECHWRRAKKKLKLMTPSELDFIEGTSYASEHIEVAADQVFYFILFYFFFFFLLVFIYIHFLM